MSAFALASLLLLAAPPAELPEDRGVAVMDLKGSNGVEEAVVALLNENLGARVEAIGRFTSVVSGADMRAMLDLEAQKAALGCDEASCIAELGGALGVPFLIVGSVGAVGSRLVLNLKLLAVEESKVVGRVSEVLPDLDAVLDAMPELVDRISVSLHVPEGKPASERVGQAFSLRNLRIGGLTVTGVGVVTGLIAAKDYTNAWPSDSARTAGRVATGLTLLGAIVTGTSYLVGGK